MVHLVAGIAAVLGALFTGAALYINVVDHPARLSLPPEMAASHWADAYRRAAPMQVGLALSSAITGIMTWFHGEGLLWLWGGLCILAVIPFTLLVIRPVNQRLMAAAQGDNAVTAAHLLVQWGRLHAVRAGLGMIALLFYLSGIINL
jgi:hypothetical protein